MMHRTIQCNYTEHVFFFVCIILSCFNQFHVDHAGNSSNQVLSSEFQEQRGQPVLEVKPNRSQKDLKGEKICNNKENIPKLIHLFICYLKTLSLEVEMEIN